VYYFFIITLDGSLLIRILPHAIGLASELNISSFAAVKNGVASFDTSPCNNLLIIFVKIPNLFSSSLPSFLYNLHNWSKFNSAILFWNCVYYFVVPVLIYRNNNLCGANQTCDYQFFDNNNCDNINKYCDQPLYNTCRINGTFTFNYENTNVINQFRESQLFLPYLYIPVVIVCGLSMWLTKKE